MMEIAGVIKSFRAKCRQRGWERIPS